MESSNIEAAVELRNWRRSSDLSRAQASQLLGISERMLAYYESAQRSTPKVVLLASRALAAGLTNGPKLSGDARERWVTLVENMIAYGKGEPVVGRMLKEMDFKNLQEFLDFVRRGPDLDLAITDPALFQTLRSAITRAQLQGLGKCRVSDEAVRMSENWKLSSGTVDSDTPAAPKMRMR